MYIISVNVRPAEASVLLKITDNVYDLWDFLSLGIQLQLNELLSISLKAHQVIGCKGVTRSDFKFENGKFYLLELNTQPGMTKLSLVPEIAAYKGISFLKLIEWMLNDASTKK